LITKQPHSVLCLNPDPRREVLWVSTTAATVHAWPLNPLTGDSDGSCSNDNAAASQNEELSPEKVPLAPKKMSRELGLSRMASRGRPSPARQQQQQHRRRMLEKCAADAVLFVPGHSPLVRYAVFDDRRHVLTLDADGCVGLWDVVVGKHVKHFEVGSVRRRPSHCFASASVRVPV
jgi:hypothetical protein